MRLGDLLVDDRAVSPVIGVILMVAVTVILAAVVAAFVLGLGETSAASPQVSFDHSYDTADDELEILVSSGDTFTAEQVTFEGTGLGVPPGTEWHDDSAGVSHPNSNPGPGSTITGGDRAVIGGMSDDFELELVWTAESGDNSATLSTRTGPAA